MLRTRVRVSSLAQRKLASFQFDFKEFGRPSQWLAKQRIITFVFGAALIGLSFAAIYWHLNNH
jgi:hypothetical protein